MRTSRITNTTKIENRFENIKIMWGKKLNDKSIHGRRTMNRGQGTCNFNDIVFHDMHCRIFRLRYLSLVVVSLTLLTFNSSRLGSLLLHGVFFWITSFVCSISN